MNKLQILFYKVRNQLSDIIKTRTKILSKILSNVGLAFLLAITIKPDLTNETVYGILAMFSLMIAVIFDKDKEH